MALGGASIPSDLIAEGVDVFSASLDALPFVPSQRREDGEAWGYFFAAHPTAVSSPAPGGCWVLYNAEKEHKHGGDAVAFRRRFEFQATCQGDDGGVGWAGTPWRMKEYRLNEGSAAYCGARPGPSANIVRVVRKVFTKPQVPPALPPARSSKRPGF